MNEDFLHYVWKYQLFSNQNLKVTNKGVLNVLKTDYPKYYNLKFASISKSILQQLKASSGDHVRR